MKNYQWKKISNFITLKAFHHGNYWYIVDCTEGCGDPYKNFIGGFHHTYEGLCCYADMHYSNVYK